VDRNLSADLSQHMNTTFILIVVEISVDIIIVLESVLDVTAVAVAAAVRITAHHHKASLDVGVIQLTSFAMYEPGKRVVITLYAWKRRAECRPVISSYHHV